MGPFLAARLAVGGFFLWTGVLKLTAPYRFAGMVSDYGIIPDQLLLPFAFFLSLLEIAAGAGLILNLRWASGLVAALLLIFIAVLFSARIRGLDVDCGCLPADEASGKSGIMAAIVRDIVLLAAASFIIACRRFNPAARNSLIPKSRR